MAGRARGHFWIIGRSPCAALSAGFAIAGFSLRAAETVVVTTPEGEAPLVVTTVQHSWLSFGLDRIPLLQHAVLGNPLWQYLASLIFILLAFHISKLLDYLLQ